MVYSSCAKYVTSTNSRNFYLPEATKSAVYNAMLDHLNQILLNDLDLELDLEQEENEVKITHCLKIAHIISFEPFWHFSTILVLSKIELSGNTV